MLVSATWTQYFGGLDVSVAVPLAATGSATGTSIAVQLDVPDSIFTTPFARPTYGGVDPNLLRFQVGGSLLVAGALDQPFLFASRGIPGLLSFRTASGASEIAAVSLSIGHFLAAAGSAPGGGYWYAANLPFDANTLPFQYQGIPMGSADLDAAGAGSVYLVAPSRIDVYSPQHGTTVGFVSWSRLELHFVPEPSAAWLLLLAGAGLGASYTIRMRGLRARASRASRSAPSAGCTA